jgi:biopolymer transport protein ExbD
VGKEKLFINMKRIIVITLGFIVLIAGFFIYTTSISKPEAILLHTTENKPDTLNLLIPKGATKDNSKYKKVESKLTLLLLSNNMIYGYSGNDITAGKICDHTNIKNLIKQELGKYHSTNFVVTIRPAETATYRNTVDILDEMTINNIKEYEVVAITNIEREFVHQFEQTVKK